jgi:hypothetical protein
MNDIKEMLADLEFVQIGWVVPDIHQAAGFLGNALGIQFPPVAKANAKDLKMTHRGKLVDSECLTTQTYNGRYIELIQPLTGESMFSEYLEKYPLGGVQHLAYRLPVHGFEEIVVKLRAQYEVISECDHPVARMAFFDTYQTLGVMTEIMGITPEGWKMLAPMENQG